MAEPGLRRQSSVARLVRSRSAVVLTGTYGAYAASGLTVALSALLMTAHDRGVYVTYMAWAAFAAAFCSLGVGPAVAHATASGGSLRADIAKLVPMAFLHALPGVAGIGIALQTVAASADSGRVLDLFFTYLGLTGILLTDWAGYVLQAQRRFRGYAALRVAVPAAGLVLFGILALPDGRISVTAAIAAVATSTLVAGLVCIAFVARSAPHDGPGWRWRGVYRFGVRAGGGSMAAALASKLDAIVVSALLGPTQVSYYSLAVSLTMPVSAAGNALGVRSFADVASAGDGRHVGRTYRRYLGVSAALALAVVVVIPLLPVVFGPGYAQSQRPALILLLGAIAFGGIYLGSSLLQALGKPASSSAGQVVAGVAALVLVPAGALVLQIDGAAIGSTAAYTAGALVLAVLVRRRSWGSR